MLRPRPVAVALTAVLSELVIVAATGNQKVTDSIFRSDLNPRLIPYAQALNDFRWRFTPVAGSDGGQLLLAELLGIAVLLAGVFLIVLVAAHGRPHAGQVFLLSWFGTVAAAWIAGVVRTMTLPRYYVVPNQDRITLALFQNGGTVLFGVGSGLVVAAAALLVATTAQRPEPPTGYADGPVPAGYPPGGYAPSGYADGSAPAGYPLGGYAPSGYAQGGYPSGGYAPSAAPDDDTQWYRAPQAGEPSRPDDVGETRRLDPGHSNPREG